MFFKLVRWNLLLILSILDELGEEVEADDVLVAASLKDESIE